MSVDVAAVADGEHQIRLFIVLDAAEDAVICDAIESQP